MGLETWIDENAALLSNYEVLSLLKGIQSEKKGRESLKQQQNLATLSYETIKYLEKTPCSLQSSEVIKSFMEDIKPFNLTKAEKLQLLNHRPTSLVEIQLLIEESEERLTEDNMQEILQVVSRTLPTNEEPALDDSAETMETESIEDT